VAFTVTGIAPSTGPVTGGTHVTITGTGLDAVDVVTVGDIQATILAGGTATSITVRVPAGASTGPVDVVAIDTDANESHTAGTQFTYGASAGSDTLVSTLAGKIRIDVSDDGGTTWTQVRGITTAKPGVNYDSETTRTWTPASGAPPSSPACPGS
jgi:hypothetical protein